MMPAGGGLRVALSAQAVSREQTATGPASCENYKTRHEQQLFEVSRKPTETIGFEDNRRRIKKKSA